MGTYDKNCIPISHISRTQAIDGSYPFTARHVRQFSGFGIISNKSHGHSFVGQSRFRERIVQRILVIDGTNDGKSGTWKDNVLDIGL